MPDGKSCVWRVAQVKGFHTLLQTLYDDGECYAATGFAVAEYTHREYLRRLPKLEVCCSLLVALQLVLQPVP